MRQRRRMDLNLSWILVCVLGMVTAVGGGCAREVDGSVDAPYVPAGIVRIPPPDVGAISLPDVTNGVDFPFRAEADGLLVVYWGYTSCPDVCPMTMADLRGAVAGLGADGDRIDVAMVTVDPVRDSPERLTAYVQAFFPEGIAVRTEGAGALRAAAEPFGVSYEVTGEDDGNIEVAHTGFLYAVDDNGLVRLTWPFGTDSDHIQADLRSLLEGTADA